MAFGTIPPKPGRKNRLSSILPVSLEKRYDVIKPGLFGLKVGHHIIFYKKGNNGSISVDRILHERMDYQRHL